MTTEHNAPPERVWIIMGSIGVRLWSTKPTYNQKFAEDKVHEYVPAAALEAEREKSAELQADLKRSEAARDALRTTLAWVRVRLSEQRQYQNCRAERDTARADAERIKSAAQTIYEAAMNAKSEDARHAYAWCLAQINAALTPQPTKGAEG